jgi:hypothetical protein
MPETPKAQGPEVGDGPSAATPAPAAQPARRRRPLPSPLSVITAALGLFFVILTLLAIQVRNGRDPALGPGPAIPALSQPAAAGKGAQAQQQATAIVSRTSPAPPP